MTATASALEHARIAAQAASDKLATDIAIIDVSDRLAITDCFVVVTGNNDRQIGAIVDAVEEKLREVGERPVRREGERDGRWVLLDYVDVVVHVQHAEERVYYALDRLWKDCPTVPFTEPHRDGAADGTAVDAADAGGDGSAAGGDDVAAGTGDPAAGSDDPAAAGQGR